ncbi:unnamed protein product [Dovyalis caffra]|uniref:C3H1-type domain-containing protein n=1 Tax=Dovyalis caffra TaxID=77055 RepID=A0AAV1SMD5_9ROSI|nr:unnamed protein product [Dovyalis caffra]
MSGSGRKRSSKWDLKEGSRMSFEDVEDNAWPGKAGISFRDKESRRDWLSPEAVGGTRSKWSAMEPLPGRRSSRRDDNIDEDHSRTLKASYEDESYGTRMSPGLDDWRQHSFRNSPKNEYKRSRRSQSRSWSRSRSRSRSPVHGFGRESGAYDRTRSRSGVSAQLCKDFVAGRCRRGNHCQFLHQDTETYEDDWERPRKTAASKYPISHDSKQYPMGSGRSSDCCNEFLKGNCRRGESCRYSHHGASDPSSRGSANEVIRERDNDRRHRYASPERRAERETRRAADIPCKFFAAGNCRNGKYCRFSHHDQTITSPDKRSRDGRWPPSQNSDDVEKSWNGPKWSDSHTSDTAKLSEDKNDKLDAPDPRLSARRMEDGWGHNSVKNKTRSNPPTTEVVEIDKKEAVQWKTENAGDNTNVSEQRAPENWLGDMEMSPDWNYRLQPSNHINKGEHASLSSCELQEGSARVHDTSAIMLPRSNETSCIQQSFNLKEVSGSAMPHDDGVTGKTASSYINISANALATQSFNKNGLSSNASPIPNLNAVGPIQEAILTNPPRGAITIPQNQTLVQERKAINIPDIRNANAPLVNSGIPTTQTLVQERKAINIPDIRNANAPLVNSGIPTTQTLVQERKAINIPDIRNANAPLVNSGIPTTQNTASNEQLTHLTNLSVSLAQLLANGQQLPQLYAAHNSNNGTFANSEGTVKPDSVVAIPPNQAFEPRKPYDPICDSIEPGMHNVDTNPPDKKLELLSKNLSPSSLAAAPNGGDFIKFRSEQESDDKSSQLSEPGQDLSAEAAKENNGVGSRESNKVQEQDKTAQENGPLENSDGDGKADESKKNKDAKGNRAFKFALVEFVKDLLKPAWKEGQVSKDAYKNIVKKVVDKVTGTMQSASIPTTQEKIEQYLSVSKPKLTKLVQAYVEKFQKDK